jgi:DNA-binding CsgD family transcriptional regulator
MDALPFNSIARIWARANQSGTDIWAGLTELRQVLSMTRQRYLHSEVMGCYVILLALLIFWGNIEEAEQIALETLKYEERYGPLHIGFFMGWKYFYAGRHWEEGMKLLSSNIAYYQQKHFVHLSSMESVILAHLLLARGELDTARAYLLAAQENLIQANEHLSLLWMNWGCAKLFRAAGDFPLAQEWYERTLAGWQMTEDTLLILPILLDGITFYTQYSDLSRATAWLAELHALASATTNPLASAALHEAQGIMDALKKSFEPAIKSLWRAIKAWETLQFRYHYALAAQRLAELLLQHARQKGLGRKIKQHDRAEAEQLLNQALAIYEELGIITGQQAIATLRAGTRLEAQSKRRQTMKAGHPLTPREMEVLHLLVAGKSNREIATTLHIELGTAEVHVAHILNKLNCQTRTQAALYAVAQGWAKARA